MLTLLTGRLFSSVNGRKKKSRMLALKKPHPPQSNQIHISNNNRSKLKQYKALSQKDVMGFVNNPSGTRMTIVPYPVHTVLGICGRHRLKKTIDDATQGHDTICRHKFLKENILESRHSNSC